MGNTVHHYKTEFFDVAKKDQGTTHSSTAISSGTSSSPFPFEVGGWKKRIRCMD